MTSISVNESFLCYIKTYELVLELRATAHYEGLHHLHLRLTAEKADMEGRYFELTEDKVVGVLGARRRGEGEEG